MRLRAFADLLECRVVSGESLLDDLQVRGSFAADLMSDVLAYSSPGAVLVTALTTVQSVHTAHVADLAAILYVQDRIPEDAVLALARERGIPLLSTRLTSIEVIDRLEGTGIESRRRP